MSKTATKLIAAKFPSKLPDGVETIQCSRTVSMPGKEKGDDKVTVKGAAVSFNVVEEASAEGIVNFTTMLSLMGPGDDYGVRFVAQAIRSASVSGLTAALTPENHGDSLSFLPPLLTVRTIDSASAAGKDLETFMREHKRFPTQAEIKELFAEIS